MRRLCSGGLPGPHLPLYFQVCSWTGKNLAFQDFFESDIDHDKDQTNVMINGIHVKKIDRLEFSFKISF